MLFILNSGRIIVSTLTLKPRSTFSFILIFQLYTCTSFIPWLYKIKIFLIQEFALVDNVLSVCKNPNGLLYACLKKILILYNQGIKEVHVYN
jgi:hypothetical protein